MCRDTKRSRRCGSHRSPAWLISACLAAVASGVAPAIAAQTAEEYRRQIEDLEEERDHARRVFYDLVDSIPPRMVDTIRVGTLTVLAERPYVGLVREATSEAWDRLSKELKSDTGLLSHQAIYFPNPGEGMLPVTEDVVLGFSMGEGVDAGQVADGIIGAAEKILVRGAGDTIASWLPSPLLLELISAGRGWSLTASFHWTYVALVTSPYSMDRGCFAGRMVACKNALGIGEVDNPVTELYDARERRRIVQNITWSRATVFGMAALRHGCTALGSDSDCIEYLEAVPRDMLPLPFTLGARRSLVRIAIEAGGDGSYGRLVGADTLTLVGMLESVSGLTIDSLVARWYHTTMAARPTPTTITPALGLSTAVWVFLIVLTATRSSRWRS